MQAVVLAAGEGTRLRPLTADKPKGLVEVAGRPILTHCFERLKDLGADALIVVVGYREEQIMERYGNEFRGIPITYAHQEERRGLAHALLAAEEYVHGQFAVMLGDNVFGTDLADPVDRQRETSIDGALLVEEIPIEEASRYGVCETNEAGEVTGIVEKPAEPPSNLVTTGFYTFTPAVFHACKLVRPSDRGEYELTDAINLLIESGRRIDTISLDGWRYDIGYPEDRDRAERRVRGI